MSDENDHPSQVVADVLSLVEDMIDSPENVVEQLNVEIDRVQASCTSQLASGQTKQPFNAGCTAAWVASSSRACGLAAIC